MRGPHNAIVKTKNATTLRERCINHFSVLGIPVAAEALDAALLRAEKEALPHLSFLDALLGEQSDRRRERSIARRISEAHFAEQKALESFDWEFNKQSIDKQQIEQLATCDFIGRRTNVIFIGQAGVGKSHILQAIGRRACSLGYRVLYKTSAEILTELTASLADKTLSKQLRVYSRPQLLIIDEFAFDRVERLESPQAAHLLYKVIASRSQKSSTALISNIDFDKWGDYMLDGPLAMAFLDRLVEGAVIIKIIGDSYRAKDARVEMSAPSIGKKSQQKPDK
jgi:DNA replication protein DnaC